MQLCDLVLEQFVHYTSTTMIVQSASESDAERKQQKPRLPMRCLLSVGNLYQDQGGGYTWSVMLPTA